MWGVYLEKDHIAVILVNEVDQHEQVDCPCNPKVSITDEDGQMLDKPVIIHNPISS